MKLLVSSISDQVRRVDHSLTILEIASQSLDWIREKICMDRSVDSPYDHVRIPILAVVGYRSARIDNSLYTQPFPMLLDPLRQSIVELLIERQVADPYLRRQRCLLA